MHTSGSKKLMTLKIITLIIFLAMIIVNILANSLPINGVTTGDISEKFNHLFNPADYTFSTIWIVIYIMLAGYIIYQLGLSKKLNHEHHTNERLMYTVNKYFIITLIASILWVFTWHYELIFLSTLAMIIMLICLIAISININKAHLTKSDMIFIKVPFSVLFGWITIATISNITSTIVNWGWDGFGVPQLWAIILLLLAIGLAIFVMIKHKDIAYGVVFLWAFIGILVRHLAAGGYAGEYIGVIIVTIINIIVVTGLIIYLCMDMMKRRKEIEDMRT